MPGPHFVGEDGPEGPTTSPAALAYHAVGIVQANQLYPTGCGPVMIIETWAKELVREAVAAERERCAKIALDPATCTYRHNPAMIRVEIAAAIREGTP